MGFFSRHRKAFRSVIASFGMLFGLLTGCATNPVVEQEKEPENAQVMPFSSGNLNLGIDGLSASYTGEGSFSYNGGKLTGTVTTSDWGGKRDATLEIKNVSNGDLNVSLKVTAVKLSSQIAYSDGEATVWDKSIKSAPQTIEGKLSFGQSFKVYLKAGGNGKTTSISISSIQCSQTFTYSVTFKPCSPINLGRFFVDGTEILEECTKAKPYGAYNLSFVPSIGYTFVGWDVDGSLVSNSLEYSFTLSKNYHVVFPRVPAATTAMFSVGGLKFSDLNEAISKAKSGSDKTIVAVKDGIVASGNYTLDSGLSLLIPNEGGATLSQYATEDPKHVENTATQCVLFRKISFLSGANLIVYGQVVVCCTPAFKTVSSDEFNTHTAIPSGAYGQIDMQQGSTMILQSGAKLFAWGFVTGNGLVEAKSGSTVYELFQISSWRGGGVAKNMNKNKQKVFVINQYYVQNVECELKLWTGATEKTLTGMYMSYDKIKQVPHPTFVFIGNGGMFNLTQGYLTKKYIPSSDRLEFEVWGNGQLSSIAFSLTIDFVVIKFPIDLDARDYVLPINNNISIAIKSGSACSANQDLGFLPGSELIVEQGAWFEVQSGHNITFYDLDNWGNYATEAKLRPVAYSPTRTKTRTEADLKDAKLALDGTLTVGSGSYLMTTGKNTDTNIGARIISPGRTGVIKFTDAGATSYPDVYQYNNGTYVAIDHSCAKLQNGDHSYTQSAPGNTYHYDKVLDRWSLSTEHATKSGLFKTIDNNGVIKTVLLENDVMATGRTGLFHYSSTNTNYKTGDNHYYYLQSGVVVSNKKWYQENGKWYFFGSNQYAYQGMSAVFTASTGITGFGIQARYFFNDAATVERLVTVNNVVGLSQDITIITIDTVKYCYYKSIKAGVGLFEKQSGSNYSVYLAKDDGTLMANGTYYVPSHKINNIKDSSGKVLTAGLYYFDANGHMYDSNFKEITRGTAS